MSNPVVTVTNSIPEPADPMLVRKSYMMKLFDSIDYFVYPEGVDASGYTPTDMGQEFYVITQLGDMVGRPNFITADSWVGLKSSPSINVTANFSVTPKILTPSTLMVDNGYVTPNGSSKAYWDFPGQKELFNWTITNAEPGEWMKWIRPVQLGSQYISVDTKIDTNASEHADMSLADLTDPPTGNWVDTPMVAGGAFVLMLNVLGITPGQASQSDVSQNKWSIEITFGEVTMTLSDASSMKVNIGAENSETIVNLAEGAAKEGPPQSSNISDKTPIVIGVYPCWNGIMVTSGSQDTPQVVKTACTFCRKLKAASIENSEYSNWFDAQNPSNVEVGIGSIGGANNVMVNMGDSIGLLARNCKFELAYLPRFFSGSMSFDGWWLLSSDTPEIGYSYDVYTIYTKNGTSYALTPPSVIDSGKSGEFQDTTYRYATWQMEVASKDFQRTAGEIFSYILETKETRQYSIKNGNGNFVLTWTGGVPGDPSPTVWTDYIKSVSVTIGIDGSSGQVSDDKYSVAGQDAVANQCIGAFVLEAIGGKDTVAGKIFEGLAMGVASAEESGDATWTIPLIGLEKKLDDIGLINPPFVDGWSLSSTVDFLCRYAGINYDLSNANGAITLSSTEEINAARFDWKSGTSVRSALEEVLQDVLHWYVVRDGMVYIYELGTNGLPVSLGPDQSTGYDSTKMISIDKTPDFDDLRNYVVGLALQRVPEGKGTDQQSVPTFPMIEARTKTTTPDVPWAKCLVRGFPGALSPDQLSDIVDRMSNMSSVYNLVGNLQIPGNADIRPYDRWGDLVVSSVTHSINLESKTWTTSLEFMKNTI